MPQIKEARSKCGSLENISHVPGGGDVKIFSRKPEFEKNAKPRIDAKNDGYTPQGGDVKVFSEKVTPLKVTSKVGSLENINHVPGGGDKKIFNQPTVYQ